MGNPWAHPADGFDAVYAGHAQIGDDNVGIVLGHALDQSVTGCGSADEFHAVRVGHEMGEGIQEQWMVVGDDDAQWVCGERIGHVRPAVTFVSGRVGTGRRRMVPRPGYTARMRRWPPLVCSPAPDYMAGRRARLCRTVARS